MKRNWSSYLFVYVCFCAIGAVAQNVDAQTVFHYRASQGAGGKLPLITDAGAAGNDGMADETTRVNSNIPTMGVPGDAGNRSFNGMGEGGINSGSTSELLNSKIADAGGFTMESWIWWDGTGTVNSIIDYAGTEKLVVDTRQGAGNEVRMRINSDSAMDSLIGTIQPETWHYVAAVFDTAGGAVDAGAISGTFDLYLDGSLVNTTDTLTISDFGDSLDRPIGVAKHPSNFELDRFNGLVFEPRVTLGALSSGDLLYVVPEPSSVVLMLTGLLVVFRRVHV